MSDKVEKSLTKDLFFNMFEPHVWKKIFLLG